MLIFPAIIIFQSFMTLRQINSRLYRAAEKLSLIHISFCCPGAPQPAGHEDPGRAAVHQEHRGGVHRQGCAAVCRALAVVDELFVDDATDLVAVSYTHLDVYKRQSRG